jgi:L-threonylcarbamoyladenylate synthase
VESTVLSVRDMRILRPGGISREQIEDIAGPMPESGNTTEGQADTPLVSPGMLKSHYAPERPLRFYQPEEMIALPCYPEDGYLFFSGASRNRWLARTKAQDTVRTLSEAGNPIEAAAHLFEYLRLMDSKGIRCIHAEALPEEGIGAAVNDRLRRAAAF